LDPDEPADNREAEEIDAEIGEKRRGGGHGRVLIVDDDQTNTEIFSEIMAMNGYDVFIAHTGRDGITMFQEVQPDVILMDVQMPEMDGLEATRRIRVLPAGKTVKIIALTALAMEEDIQRCMDAGMDAFLSKPVPLQKLVATIAQCIGNENKGD
jgi:two-component system sensor histidine kinase/response regulator